ncbi:hypothetical protein [Nostoc sp. UHCC 0870]|uniref:hypothetical protein n=1 Tax=Nostoc sp. UHCC 0870 TaxID=2914041 RepID=UPI001EDCA0C4|nr:hypothetical protein [Nostoc sp. UHCC 0870]UKO98224.1 hypothetical protein L6494_00245 [Nostoc sp. UHCC 0870]
MICEKFGINQYKDKSEKIKLDSYMSLSYVLEKLHFLKIEYLLPLPLLLIAFGLGGESLTNILLSRSHPTVDKLQADTQTFMIRLASNVVITETKIEKQQDFTQFEFRLTNSYLKKLTLRISATELNKVKAIVEELGLSSEIATLQPHTQMQLSSTFQVVGILSEIEKEKGFTKVEVNTTNSILKKLEFEFPVTELSKVKTAIVQELGLSRENARILVSYRVKN